MAQTVGGEPYIHRNDRFNRAMLYFSRAADNMVQVFQYLKAHEQEPQLKGIDIKFLQNLNAAINNTKEARKELEGLRDNASK